MQSHSVTLELQTEEIEMTTREFNLWVASLPKVTKVIGTYADGTQLTVEVGSLFGDTQ